jgi:hypothetical protein
MIAQLLLNLTAEERLRLVDRELSSAGADHSAK